MWSPCENYYLLWSRNGHLCHGGRDLSMAHSKMPRASLARIGKDVCLVVRY